MAVKPCTIITIDVEEWFHGHNYLDQMPPETWADQESRVWKNTTYCLDLLDQYKVTATFFVLGWTAERHPDLIQEIVRRGHEIGSHSYAHPVVFELTADEFRRDCDQALNALAAAGVSRVQGYRAPSFSITPPVHSYLEILQDLGFTYDSSIFPVRHRRYGQPGAPRQPFYLGEGDAAVLELPMPTWRCLGVNVPFSGGAYLRIWPWPIFRLLRQFAQWQGQPCIVYLHPWELDDFKPDLDISRDKALISQGGQSSMPVKLEAILRSGEFETMADYAQRVKAAADVPVRPVGTF